MNHLYDAIELIAILSSIHSSTKSFQSCTQHATRNTQHFILIFAIFLGNFTQLFAQTPIIVAGSARVSNQGFLDAIVVDRGTVAGTTGVQPGAVVFTSNGTTTANGVNETLFMGGPAVDGDFYVSAQMGFGSGVTPNYLMRFSRTKGTGAAGQIDCFRDFIVNNGGNRVGIGTSTPTAILHAVGGVRFENLSTNSPSRLLGVDGQGNVSTSSRFTLGYPLYSYANYSRSVINFNTFASTSVELYAFGQIGATEFLATSDRRFKKDIQPIPDGLAKIQKLNGVSYHWRKDEFKDRGFSDDDQLGFIAQDVAKVLPEAVMVDTAGYFHMKYNMVIPVLTEAIKEQQIQIEELHKEIATLKNAIGIKPSNGTSGAKIMQNTPNPFLEQTEISYFVPENAAKAFVNIYDMNGRQVSSYAISQKGEGKITINGTTLRAGMYLYALIIDGKEIDTKKMILTEK